MFVCIVLFSMTGPSDCPSRSSVAFHSYTSMHTNTCKATSILSVRNDIYNQPKIHTRLYTTMVCAHGSAFQQRARSQSSWFRFVRICNVPFVVLFVSYSYTRTARHFNTHMKQQELAANSSCQASSICWPYQHFDSFHTATIESITGRVYCDLMRVCVYLYMQCMFIVCVCVSQFRSGCVFV